MLAVTGIGMVTPLGLDAITSCAGARAGLRRIEEIDDFYEADSEGGDPVPVAGHRVPLIAVGFFGFGRLLQLAAAGLADLQRSVPDLGRGRLGFVLMTGSPTYQEAWLSQARANPDEDPEELDTYQARLAASDRQIDEGLLEALLRRADLRVEPPLRATLRSTSVGLVAALLKAHEWLRSGACDRCVVGAVDSLVDPDVLGRLLDLGLLKTPARPIGMIPGEAAVFHLLEPARGASARGTKAGAIIETPMAARGPRNPLMAGTPDAREDTFPVAVAQTIASVYGGRFGGPLLASLNGDEHRAQVWSNMLLRLRRTHDISDLPAWLPSLAFGDTGAAFGCVSIAMLVRSWARRYAPAPEALVCLQDDVGGRGVVPVRAPRD
jgi:3-oxoacyl-[acyl-carrier-protein] synthase-1